MRVALIFDKTRPDTTGVYLERVCHQLGLAADHWWLRDVERIPAAYDLYLRIDHGDDYAVPLPPRLRPAVFYVIDTHVPHNWRKIRRIAPRYDLIFCSQREAAECLPDAKWLPLACDAELHRRIDTPMVWDVAFVGTDGGAPRKFYLQALRERYRSSFIGRADYRELASIYSRARIGFNYSIANDVNMRIFEILASETILLTNALDGDDLRRLGLEDRRHLVLYRTPRQLFDLIDDLLAHPQQREAMAQAGARLARERHTYAHRMSQLLHHTASTLDVALPQLREELTAGSFS